MGQLCWGTGGQCESPVLSLGLLVLCSLMGAAVVGRAGPLAKAFAVSGARPLPTESSHLHGFEVRCDQEVFPHLDWFEIHAQRPIGPMAPLKSSHYLSPEL